MRLFAIALAAILAAEPLSAARHEVIKSDWDGFLRYVSALKLNGRSVRIRFLNGGEVKSSLVEATNAFLVVGANRATKQWSSGQDMARIPREQVASLRFSGRVGNHGRLGLIAGLGAGAGVAAALTTKVGCYEGPCVIVLPVAGVTVTAIGGVAGYFVGRSTGRPAPEFVLTQ
jgi:hypothetical protein